jgi:hypothetical protein
VTESENVEGLNPSVRKDLQVRILPPLPTLFPSPALPVHLRAYSYLLGAYLGDGYLCRMPRTWRLEVYLHREDAPSISRVSAAIKTLRPEHRVGLRRHGAAVVVTSYFKGWPALFPQHGAGLKHTRRIALSPWQREIFERHPQDFIRGCVDSDGCRHRRVVAGRNYPAYSFKNHSQDILALFAEACGLAGIHCGRANQVTISIARRADVGRLDEIMGRPPAPGPFLIARERAWRPYSFRSYVRSGLPITKFAIAASS